MKRKPAYIDFTKAVLETIEENPQKTQQEIQDIILEKYEQFTHDDISEDDNQIQRVIRYLTLAEFTTQDEDGRCTNTPKGSQQLSRSNLQINKTLTDKLSNLFKIPKDRDNYYTSLNYLRNNPEHPLKRNEMVWDIIRKTSKYAENKDICELRAAKGTFILHSRYDFSIYFLKELELIKNTEDKGYQITQKGLDILTKYETEEEVNEYVDTILQQHWKHEDKLIEDNLASDADGHLKIFYRESEVTYLEVLIPLLKIIDSKYYTNQKEKIKDIIIKIDEFESYNKEDVLKSIDTALHYLCDGEYITIESGEILKTTKLVAIANKLDYRMKYVDSLDIEESEKEKKRQKRKNNILREINKSLLEAYDVPDKEYFYKDILKYLHDNKYCLVNDQEFPHMYLFTVRDFLEKYDVFSDDIMGIIDPGLRKLSINLIIEDAFKELKRKKLVRNTKKYGYIIEDKGLQYLENPENTIDNFKAKAKNESVNMKVFFKDDLTYLDILIPALEIINEKYVISEDELIKALLARSEFSDFRDEEIIKQAKITIHYLHDAQYVKIKNGEIESTYESSKYLNYYNNEMRAIDNSYLSDEEKQKKQRRRDNHIKIQFNERLIKAYNVPSHEDYHEEFLRYLRDDKSFSRKKRWKLQVDFLEKHTNFSDEIMGIIYPTHRTRYVFEIINGTFADLRNQKLLKRIKEHGYYITDKGLKYLENIENHRDTKSEEAIDDNTNNNEKTIENKELPVEDVIYEKENVTSEPVKSEVEEDNVEVLTPVESEHITELKNHDMTTDNTYARLVFDVLCDNEEHEKVDIIDKIEETLIPGVVIPREIKNVIKDNIQDALDKFAQYNIIEPGERFGYWKITQKAITIAQTIDDETPTVNIVSENIADVDNEIDSIDEDIIESPLEDEIENETIDTVEVVAKDQETTEFIEINPVDTFKKAYGAINKDLKRRLLNKVKSCSPYFFEKLVLDLFMKMDYNRVKPKYGEVTKKSNDGGIDGVIQLGYLNTNPIYYQAKRYDSNIQRPAIHQFIGALREIKSDTGIFITTSGFSKGAIEAAKSENISMIDGDELVNLMIKFEIGIKVKNYDVKLIDDKYFED